MRTSFSNSAAISLAALSLAASVAASALASGATTPLVLYTDVTSGPNSGGEHDEGAYLSIFGKNFGSTGLGTSVKVYIGGVEAGSYRYLGPSRGRPDVGQITVQVGHLGTPAIGKALPIQVVVNGAASTSDQTFTVNPGRMLFVSQRGDDAKAVPGDVAHPYRHVQNGRSGAFDIARAGDTIVLLGTPLRGAAITSDPTPPDAAWQDVSRGYFVRFRGLDGTAPTGKAGTGPIALIAYPDEDAYVYESYAGGAKGAISGVDGNSYRGGHYVTVADLRIESGGPSGVVNEQVAADHWRVVNNEITAVTGSADRRNRAAGIDGAGTNSYWVGNHVHNINSGASTMTMHAIYIGGDGSYEVAYNWLHDVTDGSGFQVYTDEGQSSTTNNVSFHHNIIYNVKKYGINIADGSGKGFVYYDNVVHGTGFGCLRFKTNSLHDARIYNNTFYDCSTRAGYGVVVNDGRLPPDALDMENNIFYAKSGGGYFSRSTYSGGDVGMSAGVGMVTHNLFYNGSDGTDWDSHPVTGDPLFVSVDASDFHLRPGSPAIGAGATAVAAVVTNDYDSKTRSASSFDIGAYLH